MEDEQMNHDPDYFDVEGTSYELGFKEGLRDGKTSGLLEGRQFGLEQAFDRFRPFGVIQGLIEVWEVDRQVLIETNAKVRRTIGSLKVLVANVPESNKDEDVEDFTRRFRQANAKLKVLSSLLGEPVLVAPSEIQEEDAIEDTRSLKRPGLPP